MQKNQFVPNFKSLPATYEELILHLENRIDFSEKKLRGFEKRHYNRVRENAILYCLRHSIDLSKGCFQLATAELPDSLSTLCRANFETLIWTRYVSLSEENAQKFTDHGLNELKRLGRNTLKAGHARVVNQQTKEDITKKVLGSEVFDNLSQGIKLKDAAIAGGLEKIYTSFYGFISMPAHGLALGIEDSFINPYYPAISLTIGALQCCEVTAINWIEKRQQTSQETITQILGI